MDMDMDLESTFEIAPTADFIHSRGFTRVALQFPDDLLKYSTQVVGSLKKKIRSFRAPADEDRQVGLFIMADTTYGSCCVDEVAASHVDADCVVHYGQTCLSPTSALPAFFVFGKASIDISACVAKVSECALTHEKPIMVLYGLEYAYALPQIREEISKTLVSCGSEIRTDFKFADVICSIRNPSEDHKHSNKVVELSAIHVDDNSSAAESDSTHIIGGLVWNLPQGKRMEDYTILWIGPDNSAFANVVLTYNSCEIVRYDAGADLLVTDVSDKKRILKRRYYLVEKAKDSNIVGILVGTLGVAGYLGTIHRMKELVMGAGKKAYTLVMGKPNPAKLANFPECDVFIYVSCAQTALLDSKEFLAPVITPFEAMLAFSRGSQWTGKYMMGFQELVDSPPEGERNQSPEARYSFILGGYVEDFDLQENGEESDRTVALANATQKALQLRDKDPSTLVKGIAKSGAEFFVTRSYHGLETQAENRSPEAYAVGRSGRASGYIDEDSRQGNHGQDEA